MIANPYALFTLAVLGLGTWTVLVWGLVEIIGGEIERRCVPVREGNDAP